MGLAAQPVEAASSKVRSLSAIRVSIVMVVRNEVAGLEEKPGE